MKKLKEIPNFKDGDERGKFWDTHDSGEYIDWSKRRRDNFA
ncbi:MAG: CopG family antitoxin [Candidatus Saccharimonadales bacterium]